VKKKKIIDLKILTESEVSKRYHYWMNDKNVLKYTAQFGSKHSIKDIINFVREKRKSKNEFLYGIFISNQNNSFKEHIGNIKLGPINFRNLSADVSYLIGEKKYWGKGYATLAVNKIVKIAKKKFKLRKLQAGHQKNNLGSSKVLLRNKFKLEGIFKSQIRTSKNKRTDRYVYGLIL
tara:strand:- start:559 stop:1089 length:531 start_codon:yes stop_codon:yes gene_type:complete